MCIGDRDYDFITMLSEQITPRAEFKGYVKSILEDKNTRVTKWPKHKYKLE